MPRSQPPKRRSRQDQFISLTSRVTEPVTRSAENRRVWRCFGETSSPSYRRPYTRRRHGGGRASSTLRGPAISFRRGSYLIMAGFREMFGAIYIFENAEANRVKIGMTINHVSLRLRSLNQMWLDERVTCQVCGTRRLAGAGRGRLPQHPSSQHGTPCPGSRALPLEKDISVADAYLQDLRTRRDDLSGTERASATRMINTLARRIEVYRELSPRVGVWKFRVTFLSERAEEVELSTHRLLDEQLDREAPFGEVFTCSVEETAEAVESTLRDFGLLQQSRRETRPEAARSPGAWRRS